MAPCYKSEILWEHGAAYYRGSSGQVAGTGITVEAQRRGDIGPGVDIRNVTINAHKVTIGTLNYQSRPGLSTIEVPIDRVPELIGALLDAYQVATEEITKAVELVPEGSVE